MTTKTNASAVRIITERDAVTQHISSMEEGISDVASYQFKARLDKFWLHQDILYDYTADLTGIGDRSVHVTKDE